jgi:hypothetical protein
VHGRAGASDQHLNPRIRLLIPDKIPNNFLTHVIEVDAPGIDQAV